MMVVIVLARYGYTWNDIELSATIDFGYPSQFSSVAVQSASPPSQNPVGPSVKTWPNEVGKIPFDTSYTTVPPWEHFTVTQGYCVAVVETLKVTFCAKCA